jgi:hypothetical protein
MRLASALAATVAVSLAVPVAAGAADYSYRTIAEGSSFGQCPAINNLGAVAFRQTVFNEETFNDEDSVLRGSGGPLTTIADESDGFDSIVGNPSINDLGAVAFDGNPDGSVDRELIARGSGGPLTEIARAGETRRFDSFTADVSLNLLGRVAFTGELNETGDEGLFQGAGGAVATRYLASTSPFAGSISPPSLNDLESASFVEETDELVRGVFRQGPGGAVTTIADESDGLQGFASHTSLNNLGRVAFAAFDESGEEVILTGRGGPLTEVASTTGEYAFFGGRGPSINDLGQVAFQADLDDFSSSGVFTGPDPVDDAVIRTGDVIGGKTVQSVSACREMLNARGQVAALVTYDDFSAAIVRATPRR